MQWGLALKKYEGTCRSIGAVRLCCGEEKPPGDLVPVCQVFILLFSCSHSIFKILRNNFWGKSRRNWHCFFILFQVYTKTLKISLDEMYNKFYKKERN
jgi:hypothetical protein